AGGPQGRMVSYDDAMAETRSQQYAVTLGQNWLTQVTHSDMEAIQNTWSSSDGQTYSRSTTNTAGWEDSTSKGTSNTVGTTDSMERSTAKMNMGSNSFTKSFNGSASLGGSTSVAYVNEKGGYGTDLTERGGAGKSVDMGKGMVSMGFGLEFGINLLVVEIPVK